MNIPPVGGTKLKSGVDVPLAKATRPSAPGMSRLEAGFTSNLAAIASHLCAVSVANRDLVRAGAYHPISSYPVLVAETRKPLDIAHHAPPVKQTKNNRLGIKY